MRNGEEKEKEREKEKETKKERHSDSAMGKAFSSSRGDVMTFFIQTQRRRSLEGNGELTLIIIRVLAFGEWWQDGLTVTFRMERKYLVRGSGISRFCASFLDPLMRHLRYKVL